MSFSDKLPAILYLGGAACAGAVLGEIVGENAFNVEGWGAAVGAPLLTTAAFVVWFLSFRAASKELTERDFPLDYIDRAGGVE